MSSFKKICAEANAQRDRSNFRAAEASYEQALQAATNGEDQIELYNNRSLMWIRWTEYSKALADSEAVLAINSTWYRGYFRKAEALYHLGRFVEALEAVEAGLTIKATSELKGLKKKIEKAVLESSTENPIPPKIEAASTLHSAKLNEVKEFVKELAESPLTRLGADQGTQHHLFRFLGACNGFEWERAIMVAERMKLPDSHCYEEWNASAIKKLRKALRESAESKAEGTVTVAALAIVNPACKTDSFEYRWTLVGEGGEWVAVRGYAVDYKRINIPPACTMVSEPERLVDDVEAFLSINKNGTTKWTADAGRLFASITQQPTLVRKDLKSLPARKIQPMLMVVTEVVSKKQWEECKQRRASFWETLLTKE